MRLRQLLALGVVIDVATVVFLVAYLIWWWR
jgi:hypothetical protein